MGEAAGERVDGLWARRLGCEAALLSTPGIHLLQPDTVAARAGVFLLARDGTLLVRGESPVVHALVSRLGDRTSLPGPDLVCAALGARVERIVGPAFLGYRESPPQTPAGAGALRSLGSSDRAALVRLRDAVRAEEWEHSGLSLDVSGAMVAGAFEDERLLAAASFEMIFGVAAHLGVLTHPSARGLGAGSRVIAAAAQAAAARGLLLQYQTLESNRPSMRIAERLGFRLYATSLAVSLLDATKTYDRWQDQER